MSAQSDANTRLPHAPLDAAAKRCTTKQRNSEGTSSRYQQFWEIGTMSGETTPQRTTTRRPPRQCTARNAPQWTTPALHLDAIISLFDDDSHCVGLVYPWHHMRDLDRTRGQVATRMDGGTSEERCDLGPPRVAGPRNHFVQAEVTQECVVVMHFCTERSVTFCFCRRLWRWAWGCSATTRHRWCQRRSRPPRCAKNCWLQESRSTVQHSLGAPRCNTIFELDSEWDH